MPFASTPLTIAPATQTAIITAINAIKTQLATIGNINMTKDEKALPSIDNVREPFVRRMLTLHAVSVPGVVPPGVNLANATTRLNNAAYCRSMALQCLQLAEMFNDLSHHEEVPTYQDFLNIYAGAQLGARGNVPGADAVVDDIKPLFDLPGQPQP